jgi:redox-sensitive bicupin YhaK (pirin superfamily)
VKISDAYGFSFLQRLLSKIVEMSSRTVALRVQRRPGHKIIDRMFSPGELGRTLKPFVFLDFLHGDVKKDGLNFGMHPHSGQQTLTYSNAPVYYTDTEGKEGLLPPGGIEYMNPGGGAWHSSVFKNDIRGLRAFQFWFASPPGIEDGPSESIFLEPVKVPRGENFKLLMGEYKGVKNPLPNYSNVNVLDVSLQQEGQAFEYIFPEGHLTSFIFVYEGSALVEDDEKQSSPAEIFVLDKHGDRVAIQATTKDTRVIVASAVPWNYSLSLGMYSVHTNPESLARGEARINEIGERLSREGKL